MIAQALSLVAIIGIGHLIRRIGWVKVTDFTIFSRIVLWITLPAALVTYFNTFHITVSLLGLALVGMLVNFLDQVTSWALTRSRGRRAQAFGVLNTGTFNIGAFATPYMSGFVGPGAILYTSIFDVGNSLAAAGVGRAWGLSLARPEIRATIGMFLRRMFSSVVFVTYLSLLIMRLAGITLPSQVITFTSTVGAANPFMAMLMIGIGLDLELSRRQLRAAASFLAVRYFWSTLVAIGFWQLTSFPLEAKVAITMVLFAPIAAMTPGFTDEGGLDVQLSSFMTTVSILVAIVVLPTLYLALG